MATWSEVTNQSIYQTFSSTIPPVSIEGKRAVMVGWHAQGLGSGVNNPVLGSGERDVCYRLVEDLWEWVEHQCHVMGATLGLVVVGAITPKEFLHLVSKERLLGKLAILHSSSRFLLRGFFFG